MGHFMVEMTIYIVPESQPQCFFIGETAVDECQAFTENCIICGKYMMGGMYICGFNQVPI